VKSAAPSIHRRLANALLLWSLLGSVGVALAVALAAQYELEELLDETLQATAAQLAATLVDTRRTAAEVLPAADDDEFAWQVVSADGHVLQRAANAPSEPLLRPGSAGFADVGSWRVHARSLDSAGRWLIVAHALEERREAQFDVVLGAALAALSIGLLGHLWLRLRVRDELRPLERLSERLAAYDPAQTQPMLGPAERAELEPVHGAVEDLARRLAQRAAQERLVAAHAAHALRTPLAGMDAQLAIALRESAPEARPRLQRVRDASIRLQRVVRSLIDLFRIGADVRRETVRLAPLLAHLPVSGLTVDVDAQATVAADPDLLAAALSNLLDNAQRHGARRVIVSTPLAATVRIADDGSGIEPARLTALRDALRTQAYEGQTGLGLMLADLVARAHGGGLRLPEVASGFAVDLMLAAEPPTASTDAPAAP
jgi:signal transduction histidine kinase